MTELVSLLAELVRIPSPNPPGDATRIATFVAEWLRPTGADVRVVAPPTKPEAPSVIATMGDGGAPHVMLHAHIDTVPVAEAEAGLWTHDPYDPQVVEGRLYGKGSIDDKAPLAAMMMAFAKVSRAPTRRGTVTLVAAAEEETGGRLGTRWLADEGHLPPCDLIVVGEQTDNRIALAHKGVMRATIRTKGSSVHATNPDRGVNAISAMARVVLALEEYHRALAERTHPLVGHPTCNVGTIVGGSTANAVPDSCAIRIDRRMIPREAPESVERELAEVVGRLGGVIAPATAEVGEFQFSSWFDSGLTTPLGAAFREAVRRESGRSGEPVGYLPGSDAKHLMGLARGDMIVFGPGSYEVAHAADEHADVHALEECEAILTRFFNETLVEPPGATAGWQEAG